MPQPLALAMALQTSEHAGQGDDEGDGEMLGVEITDAVNDAVGIADTDGD